jgi:hypothetical protein
MRLGKYEQIQSKEHKIEQTPEIKSNANSSTFSVSENQQKDPPSYFSPPLTGNGKTPVAGKKALSAESATHPNPA